MSTFLLCASVELLLCSLDEAQTFVDISVDMPAATDDLQLVLATTARPREANVPVLAC